MITFPFVHNLAPPNRTQAMRFHLLFSPGMYNYKNDKLYDVCWDKVGDLGQMSMAKSGEMYH